jgi:hypothetical protein
MSPQDEGGRPLPPLSVLKHNHPPECPATLGVRAVAQHRDHIMW